MKFLTLVPIALAAFASAQDTNSTSSVPYSNPATTLLTQTNSLGVITGQPTQPAVVTTQPAGVFTQPSVALLPAGFTSGTTTLIYGNQTYTVGVSGNQTQIISRTPTPTTQSNADTTATTTDESSESGAAASGSGSASSSSTGAAMQLKAGGAALAAAGGFFAFFM